MDTYQKLLDASFLYISFRPRSEKELRGYLQKKINRWDIPEASSVLSRVIERVKELGMIDDQKFLAWWVSQRVMHKPKGRRALAQELRTKGLALEGMNADLPSERELAKNAAQKKMRRWGVLDKDVQKKKLYGFLSRRGFSSDVVFGVIDELLENGYNRVT